MTNKNLAGFFESNPFSVPGEVVVEDKSLLAPIAEDSPSKSKDSPVDVTPSSRKRRRVTKSNDFEDEKTDPKSKRRSKKERKDSNGRILSRMKSEKDLEEERIEKEKGERTVFLGNVPVAATKKDIKKLCKEKVGGVESLRIRSYPVRHMQEMTKKVLAIQKFTQEGRDSMSAYVVFEDVDTAKKAVDELNGICFLEKHLRADMANSSDKPRDIKNTVFVGNLPYTIEEEELYAVFESYGVQTVRLIRDKETSMCKGFGYVTLKEPKSVTKALGANIEVHGRTLRIRTCVTPEALQAAQTAAKGRKYSGGKSNYSSKKPVLGTKPKAPFSQSVFVGKAGMKGKGKKDKTRWRDRAGGIEGERERRLLAKQQS